jgi:excinuclease ABC subunit C
MIPPSHRLSPSDPQLVERLGQLPNRLGVYVLTPETGNPYLGWSGYLSKRLSRLLLGSRLEHSNQLAKLRSKLTGIDYWLTGSRLETSLLVYWLARKHDPERYRQRLKLKLPWLVELLIQDAFPRLSVQNRHTTGPALSFGPFPTRDAAERFQQGTESLFQIRRCVDRLAPHHDHPGCIFGEMNLCMRPCQLAVTASEYAAEVRRVREFLESKGRNMMSVLTAARDLASEQTGFEEAARIHREIERVKVVVGLRDELVSQVEYLNGVALTRGAADRSVALWPMVAGYWQPALTMDFSMPDADSRSLDQRLREKLGSHLSSPRSDGDRLEQIALLSRWYYSSWRDGVWFAFNDLSDLNYRALVRGVSALLRETDAIEETGQNGRGDQPRPAKN